MASAPGLAWAACSGVSDAAEHKAALLAAERLTAGYRRSGEQVKRRISTEKELQRWRLPPLVIVVFYVGAALIASVH
jgi:hypothetical protein